MARKSDIRLRRSNVLNSVPGSANLSDGELAMNTNTGALYFKKSDSTIITAADNTIFHIDSDTSNSGANKKIGIGTTSPAFKLSVNSGTIDWPLHLKSTDNKAGVVISDDDTTGYFGVESSKAFMGLQAGIHVNNLNIDSSGNVGIGTASPARKLEVDFTGSTYGARFTRSDAAGNSLIEFANNGGVKSVIGFDSGNSGFIVSTGSTPQVVVKSSTGNVGIGTATPSTKLHVNSGTGDVAAIFESTDTYADIRLTDNLGSSHIRNSQGDLNLQADRENAVANSTIRFSVDSSEKARIDSSGNFLVGKTSTSFTVAGTQLAYDGAIVATRSANPIITLNRLSTDGELQRFYKDGTQVGSIGTTGGDLYIGKASSSSLRFQGAGIRPSTGATLADATYELGGASARFTNLHLSGVINAGAGTHTLGDGTGSSQFVLLAGTTGFSTIDFGDSADGNIGRIEYIHSSDAMTFRSNNTERMRIDSSGNVGIGTSNPSEKLHVLTTGNTVAKYETSLTSDLAIELKNSQGSMFFGLGGGEEFAVGTTSDLNGSGNLFTIKQDGSVGIGTVSPTSILHIVGSSAKTRIQDSSNNYALDLQMSSSIGKISTSADMALRPGGVESVRLKSDGNVGIGTISPTATLEVSHDNDGTVDIMRLRNGDSLYSQSFLFQLDTSKDMVITGGSGSGGIKFVPGSRGVTVSNKLIVGDTFSIREDGTNDEIKSTGNVLYVKATEYSFQDNSSNERISINSSGAIEFNNAFTFPTSIGTVGQVLKVPSSGTTLVWGTPSGGGGGSSIEDTDGDTKIQVEESADEDVIRFDIAGTEQMQLNSTGLTVAGNLTVNGTQTILNTATLSVDDLNITVADGAADAAAANGAGITVDGASATLTYTSAEDRWNFNKKLYVPDNIRIAAGGPQLILQDTTDDDDHAIRFMDNGGTNRMSITTLGDNLNFETTGSRDFTFMGDTSGSGQVLIGDSTSYHSSAQLQIIGGGSTTSATYARMLLKDADGTNQHAFVDEDGGSFSITSQNGTSDGIIKFNQYDGTTTSTRMIIEPGGDVGIGTTSPTHKLHVYDASGVQLRVESSASTGDFYKSGNDLIIANNASGLVKIWNNSVERVRIDSSGNVGIGTTSLSSKLTVEGDIKQTTGDLLYSGGGNWDIAHQGASQNIVFKTTPSGGSATEVMRIRHDGNVGIGTSSPSQALEVDGNIQATGTRSISALYDSNHYMRIEANSSGGILKGTDGGVITTLVRTYGDSYFNGGNFGIGTTAPGEKLDIVSAGSVNMRLNNTGNNVSLSIGAQSSAARITAGSGDRLGLGAGNTQDILTIASGGNVGIGTTTPTSKVHISGTSDGSGSGADAMLHVKQNGAWNGNEPWALYVEGYSYLNGFRINAGDGIRSLYKTTSGGSLGFATSDTAPITFTQSDSSEKMRVHSNGFVGIGNTTPQARLSVEEYGIDTTTSSTTATTQVAIHSFPITSFRSARFTIQITNTTDSTYHSTEILAIHDGTTANITEFGEVHTGSSVEATFDADISSGNFRLLATPSSTNSMTFKVVCHSLTV